MVRRIFISSVQRELSAERKAMVDLVSGNPQLARFFSTFAFEFDVPAADKRTDEVYLAELAVSDLYVGIIGNEYGGVIPDGVSATESEYDEATRLGIPRFLFVKGSSDKGRDPRERNFLHKVSPGLIRVRFESTAELLAYATNPIIAHALFYVKYIEELGSGTVDMFDLCKATGLRPPIFDIDARHFTVTVYRPEFDEQGNPIPAGSKDIEVKTAEVSTKAAEVSTKPQEVGPYPEQIGPKAQEVGPYPEQIGPKPQEVSPYPEQISPKTAGIRSKPDFDTVMKNYRKDFRETCARVWECLAEDSTVPRRGMSVSLRIAESSVQSAMNALQEVGLLKREGYGKGRKWIVKSSIEVPEEDA